MEATIKRVEQLFYWPSLRADVTKMVKECDTCLRNKVEHVPSTLVYYSLYQSQMKLGR